MSRFKLNYSIYRRGLKSGLVIYYYRTYTPDGIRTNGKSTGCTSKAKARLYCDELLKKGLLYNGQNMAFAQYASGWFDDGSDWLQDRLACGTPEHPALSETYITKLRCDLNNYLLPYFGKIKMEDLRPSHIKHFRTWMIQEKNLSHKTINNAVSTLRQITDYALADSVIMFDPMRGIKTLNKVEKKRDSFTIDEAVKIFHAPWKDSKTRLANLTSACTGLRQSEILALGTENIKDDYINLTYQIVHGNFCQLKTKEPRKIPLCKELHDTLIAAIKPGCDYVFDAMECQQPYIHLRYVLRDIGMELERKDRGLCYHSWRHFFNTYLLSKNVSPVKVAAILGHSTGPLSMQQRYTNFQASDMPEVVTLQKKLFDMLN